MFKKVFNKKENKPQKPALPKMAITGEYMKWRNVIFQVESKQVGVSPTEKDRVFGVVMDFGMIDQRSKTPFVLSTTAYASGEASFRPSPGGGFVGLGGDPKINQAAKDIVKLGQGVFSLTKPTAETALPSAGMIYFYLLTTSGLHWHRSLITDIQRDQKNHPFFDIFRAFSFIRMFAEKMIDSKQEKKG